MKTNSSKFIIFPIIVLLLFVGVPCYYYWHQFFLECQIPNLTAWANFSSFFNAVSSPIIAFINLILFIVITLKVSVLQERITVNQMRNERYLAFVNAYNTFCTDYPGSDFEGKLNLTNSLINQVNLYTNRMTHLFTFKIGDQDIINLQSALASLAQKIIIVKDKNDPESKEEAKKQFQNALPLAETFLTKIQTLILESING